MLAFISYLYYIIKHRKEVMDMDEILKYLALVLSSVVLSKILDELVEVIKRKTSNKQKK